MASSEIKIKFSEESLEVLRQLEQKMSDVLEALSASKACDKCAKAFHDFAGAAAKVDINLDGKS